MCDKEGFNAFLLVLGTTLFFLSAYLKGKEQ